jgi:hypothetical protein
MIDQIGLALAFLGKIDAVSLGRIRNLLRRAGLDWPDKPLRLRASRGPDRR